VGWLPTPFLVCRHIAHGYSGEGPIDVEVGAVA
jgi:hypothetical protein